MKWKLTSESPNLEIHNRSTFFISLSFVFCRLGVKNLHFAKNGGLEMVLGLVLSFYTIVEFCWFWLVSTWDLGAPGRGGTLARATPIWSGPPQTFGRWSSTSLGQEGWLTYIANMIMQYFTYENKQIKRKYNIKPEMLKYLTFHLLI